MECIYVPTDEEIENCLNGKSCSFGICDECTVCTNEREVNDEEQEK
jgi:hypothetical protein